MCIFWAKKLTIFVWIIDIFLTHHKSKKESYDMKIYQIFVLDTIYLDNDTKIWLDDR